MNGERRNRVHSIDRIPDIFRNVAVDGRFEAKSINIKEVNTHSIRLSISSYGCISKLTRQKQYFEQRKRQKLTAGSENYEDRRHKRLNHRDEPNSLDILSLNNLAAVAEERFRSDKNDNSAFQEEMEASQSFREFPSNSIMSYNVHLRKFSKEDGFSNEKINMSENVPEFSLDKGIPSSRDYLMEENNSTCSAYGTRNIEFSAETVQEAPKIPIVGNYSKSGCENLEEQKTSMASFSGPHQKSKTAPRTDGLKITSENQISVLDLLSDDQSYSRPEDLPSEEQHVAFSVQGLGKIRMKTPAHSPIRLDSFHSPTVNSRWMNSSQNVLEDLGSVLGTTDDGSFSDTDSPIEFLGDAWDMKDYLRNSNSLVYRGKRGMLLDANSDEIQDPFIRRERFLSKECENEATREGRFDMLEEFLLDDVKHDICDEKPFYMNCNIPQFPEMKCRATYECGFEDALSLGRRSTEEDWKKFSIPDGANSPLRQSKTVKDCDLSSLGLARYRGVNRSYCPKRNAPVHPFSMPDGATDSTSLISEESCSTTAEGKGRTDCLPTRVETSEQKSYQVCEGGERQDASC